MQQIITLFIFQKKLFLPSLTTAFLVYILIGTVGPSYGSGFGFAYLFSSLLFQYFIYEVKNHNEYYFYFNSGFSKVTLWGSTFVFGIIVCLISIILL